MEFFIVGCGVGSSFLTEEAKKIIHECDVVVSTPRIAQFVKENDIIIKPYGTLLDTAIRAEGEKTAVLVSGDSGFFSAARIFKDKLSEFGEVRLVCGISSMQYFFSKIGISYEDCVFESCHGRKTSVVGLVSYNKKVFLLTGGDGCGCSDILDELYGCGLGDVIVYIGERLSFEGEKITDGRASELRGGCYDELSVMFFFNENACDKDLPFNDSDFLRSGIPMTKEEVRWISVNKLNIKPNFICYDIGSGTGSVSLEMAKKANRGIVYGVDKKAEAVNLLRENIKRLGCHNIYAVEGDAVNKIKDFPAPDAVFIGGSGGKLREILNSVFEKNKNSRIVVNAVSLETVSLCLAVFKELGINKTEVTSVNVSRGRYVEGSDITMMIANNPITIISGGGVNEA